MNILAGYIYFFVRFDFRSITTVDDSDMDVADLVRCSEVKIVEPDLELMLGFKINDGALDNKIEVITVNYAAWEGDELFYF